MYRVCKEIFFCYGHRLLDYEGPCMHAHGHNGKIEIHLVGNTLDKRHILYEFGDIKEIVKKWVDEVLDHKMLLRKDDPLVKPLKELGEPMYLFDTNPTAEAIAALIYHYCVEKKLPIEEVRVWETDFSYASFKA